MSKKEPSHFRRHFLNFELPWFLSGITLGFVIFGILHHFGVLL